MFESMTDEIVTWIEETMNSQNATGRWSLTCTMDQTCHLVLATGSAKSSQLDNEHVERSTILLHISQTSHCHA